MPTAVYRHTVYSNGLVKLGNGRRAGCRRPGAQRVWTHTSDGARASLSLSDYIHLNALNNSYNRMCL
jgi:hypothetical protein